MHRRSVLPLLIALVLWALLAAVARGAECAIDTGVQPLRGGAVEYRVAGTGADVVLLHGLFAQKEPWDPVLCRLSQAGYRVTAPDLPGYGRSTGFGIDA